MKKFLFLLLSSLLLTACMGKEVQTEVIVEGVDLSENTDLTLKFFLKRSDLGLYETNYRKWHEQYEGYVFDPPDEMQAKFIYLSGVEDRTLDGGVYCSEYFYPHDCEVTLDQTQPYLVKVTYENGDYSFTEVTVPIPEAMDPIELVSPVEAPTQGSSLSLSFSDTGADSYEVIVRNCGIYNKDAIRLNPCLDEVDYTITMESGVPQTEGASVSIKDGVITVESDFEIRFEDSVEYTVKAIKQTDLGTNSISSSVSFN